MTDVTENDPPQDENDGEEYVPNEGNTQEVKFLPPNPPDPHPFEEDPEEHLGEEIGDPWDDPSQEDWPNNENPEEES